MRRRGGQGRWRDRRGLELDSGDGTQQCEETKCHGTVYLKMANFMLWVFYEKEKKTKEVVGRVSTLTSGRKAVCSGQQCWRDLAEHTGSGAESLTGARGEGVQGRRPTPATTTDTSQPAANATQAMCDKRSPAVRSRDISRDKARGERF